ncbi:hypothetical protein HK100_009782 [Physocladia obscura]|uniref:3'(2'),5'-bisphosphate nucleotidase n=1 Tax=Physocladia obscura TaxID=109957 RepID=A0AAD5T3L7_9FUNG|nr:hypothetical protein HK100_009782 [Physocladia obscura]
MSESTKRPRRSSAPSKYEDPSDSEDIPFAPVEQTPKKQKPRNPNAAKRGRKPKPVYLGAELKVAVDAVLTASRLCQSVFKTLVQDESLAKDDKSPVTVADFGAQTVVNALLLKHFPEDPIVGEEDSEALKQNPVLSERVLNLVNGVVESPITVEEIYRHIDSGNYAGGAQGRFWTLDPIDGTKGFLRGEQYAVCLALVVDGKVELGVIGCPNLPVDLDNPDGERGSLFIATRGHGAFQRTFIDEKLSKIKTAKVKTASETIFCESVESGHSSQTEAAEIAQHLKIAAGTGKRMDSQCKYGVVARGDAGIYLRIPTSDTYEEKIWGHAAGMLIVEEAGGVVTDVEGKPLDFGVGRTLKNNKGVVAATARIHAEVLEAAKKVLRTKPVNGDGQVNGGATGTAAVAKDVLEAAAKEVADAVAEQQQQQQLEVAAMMVEAAVGSTTEETIVDSVMAEPFGAENGGQN